MLVLAGAVVVYGVSLWLWPYGRCRRCGGTGTNYGSNGRRFGRCGKCGGSKSRVRFGARAVHRMVRAARKGAGWKDKSGGGL